MADMEEVNPMTTLQRIAHFIHNLPTLDTDQVPAGDSCPICLVPFASIVSGAAQNEGNLTICEHSISLSGVTKLTGCGHVFCRVDLIEWIRGRHGTCPACRDTFLDVKPFSESDYESSDGDYIPNEDDEDDEEDGFLDTDGFTDMDDVDIDGLATLPDDHLLSISDDEMVDNFYRPIPAHLTPSAPFGRVSLIRDADVENSPEHRTWELEDADGENLDMVEEDIDVDAEEEWADYEDDDMGNLGLSDGYGSESLSEGDISMPIAEEEAPSNPTVVYTGDGHSSSSDVGGSDGHK